MSCMFTEDKMQQIEPENISGCCCSNIHPFVKILKWRLMSQTLNLCSNYYLSLQVMTISVKNIYSPNIPAGKEMSVLQLSLVLSFFYYYFQVFVFKILEKNHSVFVMEYCPNFRLWNTKIWKVHIQLLVHLDNAKWAIINRIY